MTVVRFKNANKVQEIEREADGWGYGGWRVTLKDGWSFERPENGCENMRGFDTRKEALAAIRTIYPCACKQCLRGIARTKAAEEAAAAKKAEAEHIACTEATVQTDVYSLRFFLSKEVCQSHRRSGYLSEASTGNKERMGRHAFLDFVPGGWFR